MPSLLTPLEKCLPCTNGIEADISVYSSARGIGDAVCALYACTGAVRSGFRVALYSSQAHWLNRNVNPRIKLVSADAPKKCIDLNKGYNTQLRVSDDRKQWYCDNICLAKGLDAGQIKPALPLLNTSAVGPGPIPGHYVLMSPFSAWRGREWPSINWARLAQILYNNGIQVVVLGGSGDRTRLEQVFGGTRAKWWYGMQADWTINAILNSDLVIGNDSGMTHLSGMFNRPTLAIHSQMPADTLWSHTSIRSLSPENVCTACRFQADRGYSDICQSACSSLGTISPEKAFSVVSQMLAS